MQFFPEPALSGSLSTEIFINSAEIMKHQMISVGHFETDFFICLRHSPRCNFFPEPALSGRLSAEIVINFASSSIYPLKIISS